MKKVVCFGEVLWDVFKDYRQIGGAPLNVALRMNSFGVEAGIISKVGKDEDGEDIINYLKTEKINTKSIQVDEFLNTGTVDVILDNLGSASYEINYPAAWDKIKIINRSKELVKESDAFIYGSLACRDKVSRDALIKYMENAQFKVFDVNLRSPYYSLDLILDLMMKSDMIKFNDNELLEICNLLNFYSENIEDQINFIANKAGVKIICVTKGADGAVLFKDNEFYQSQKFKVLVEDTVGAGDSFLSALVFKILFNEKSSIALDFAAAVGALVASKKGANPIVNLREINKLFSQKN